MRLAPLSYRFSPARFWQASGTLPTGFWIKSWLFPDDERAVIRYTRRHAV
jgi:hypothetical protein